uniref:Glutamate receptor ionotropic, kainate 4 n=1 Tax=Sphaerodactylus townsendi TaxID=933632 RepID=A0ACB8EYK5_9SAUR
MEREQWGHERYAAAHAELLSGEAQIGHWHVTKGLTMDDQLFSSNVSETLFNTTLIVTTILVLLGQNLVQHKRNKRLQIPFPVPFLVTLNENDSCPVLMQENPYLMLKGNHQELEGNDRYEGFCVDMLKELAEILHFNYKIHLVGDGVYGVPEANGTWTGMVGELIARVSKVWMLDMFQGHVANLLLPCDTCFS